MGTFKEVKGCLITLTKKGHFDLITHGVNCFSTMGAGIAVPMRQNFNCDKFTLEKHEHIGDYNKLGQIDYEVVNRQTGEIFKDFDGLLSVKGDIFKESLIVINSYTQYHPGANLDYSALALCFKKMNHTFAGKHLGIPLIGGGIAGGDAYIIKEMMRKHMRDLDVTLVLFDK